MENILEVKALAKNSWQVKIVLPDFLGLLSIITGLFTSYGINIVRAKIGTTEKKAVDTFEVSCKNKPKWDDLEKDLDHFTKRALAGDFDSVRAEINQRIIHYLRTKTSYEREHLSPIGLQIDQNISPRHSVIDIEAEDTPAFLYELTHALALLGINIAQMEVDTVGKRVKDRLWVTTETGQKVLEEEKLKALQWAVLLVKQFTHLLPKVPDPKAALEQITSFGKDVLRRRDFSQVLLTLKKSETLQSLSQVFGTSRFLWEEFIRTQHESIFPILADGRILKVKKSRALMQKELSKLLHGKPRFEEKVETLNEFKDREMFRIDLRHILGKVSYLGDFAEEFTDLAEAVVEVAASLAFEKTLEKYSRPMISRDEASEYAVFGLGKLGGRELGYASDMEVIVLYSDDTDSASPQSQENLKFYSEMVRIFRKTIQTRGEGVFEIDMRLRPYGSDGPLAVSMNLFKNYYRPEGEAWNFERQAFIKLRQIAGSEGLGREALKLRDEFVFGAKPFDFEDVLKLRERQRRELVKPGILNAKYSAGGLLDLEYLIQSLQIAYGRKLSGDIRHPNTLKALRALWEAGAMEEKKFQILRATYIFLRSLINALRIVRGNAKDLTVPREETEEFAMLARRIGYAGDDETVRRKFKLACDRYMTIVRKFYESWMNELKNTDWEKITVPTVQLPQKIQRVSLDDLLRGEISGREKKILETLGFTDFEEVSGRLKRICPNTLAFEPFALVMDRAWKLWPQVPNPNLALIHLEQFLDIVEDKESFWEFLADSEDGLSILLAIFGTSPYLSKLLIQHPEDWEKFKHEASYELARSEAILQYESSARHNLEELRRLRHSETLRIAMADLWKKGPLDQIFLAFSNLADFILNETLRLSGLEQDLCVLGLGKLGARELNFSSDVDLMFLSNAHQDPVDLKKKIETFLNFLKEGGPEEFLYRVDLRLRPHGDHGAFFMNEADYLHYYEKEADAWESQMLIKLRPVAGKTESGVSLQEKLLPLIYRSAPSPEFFERIREIKKRYEAMTSEKGETQSNIKMGNGSIRDVEFTVQMIQMKRGREFPDLRKANTLEALNEIRRLKLLSENECETLREAYLFFRRIENRLQLDQNRQVFNLPLQDPAKLRWLALSLGMEDKASDRAADQFMRKLKDSRGQCREIFERIFYGG
ncbi:MAG: hypothetical protein HYZ84_01660 [Candidatus Omnitrophica bacterium]|nr:hypothetical protein [Candidatus Omnitrophota bacterium]